MIKKFLVLGLLALNQVGVDPAQALPIHPSPDQAWETRRVCVPLLITPTELPGCLFPSTVCADCDYTRRGELISCSEFFDPEIKPVCIDPFPMAGDVS